MFEYLVYFLQSDWTEKLCVCVCVFELNSTYLLFGNFFELIRALCIFFSNFFCVNFVNYSLNLDEDTFAQKHCCCKGENQSWQWEVYLHCCMGFRTSSECLKSGAFSFFFWTDETHSVLIVSVRPLQWLVVKLTHDGTC